MPNPIRNFLAGRFLGVQPDGMNDELWAKRKQMHDREESKARRQGQLDAATRLGESEFNRTISQGKQQRTSVQQDAYLTPSVSPLSAATALDEAPVVMSPSPELPTKPLPLTPARASSPTLPELDQVKSPRPVSVESAQRTTMTWPARPYTNIGPPPGHGVAPSEAGTPDYSPAPTRTPSPVQLPSAFEKITYVPTGEHEAEEADTIGDMVVGAKPHGAKRPMMLTRHGHGPSDVPTEAAEDKAHKATHSSAPIQGRRIRHPDLTSLPPWRIEREAQQGDAPQGWDRKGKAPVWL